MGVGDKNTSAASGDDIIDARGTIKRVFSNLYVIVPDCDSSTRFVPSNLNNAFKEDGLRIIFSGKIGVIPDNVKLVGTPLELTSIQRITTPAIFETTLTLRNNKGQEVSRFKQGEPITFELSIQNLTDSHQKIKLSSSQRYDFIVYDSQCRAILYQWSFQKAFLTVISEQSFAPGETKTFSETWDQRGNNHNPVGRGNFKAKGLIPAMKNVSETHSTLVEFVIIEP